MKSNNNNHSLPSRPPNPRTPVALRRSSVILPASKKHSPIDRPKNGNDRHGERAGNGDHGASSRIQATHHGRRDSGEFDIAFRPPSKAVTPSKRGPEIQYADLPSFKKTKDSRSYQFTSLDNNTSLGQTATPTGPGKARDVSGLSPTTGGARAYVTPRRVPSASTESRAIPLKTPGERRSVTWQNPTPERPATGRISFGNPAHAVYALTMAPPMTSTSNPKSPGAIVSDAVRAAHSEWQAFAHSEDCSTDKLTVMWQSHLDSVEKAAVRAIDMAKKNVERNAFDQNEIAKHIAKEVNKKIETHYSTYNFLMNNRLESHHKGMRNHVSEAVNNISDQISASVRRAFGDQMDRSNHAFDAGTVGQASQQNGGISTEITLKDIDEAVMAAVKKSLDEAKDSSNSPHP